MSTVHIRPDARRDGRGRLTDGWSVDVYGMSGRWANTYRYTNSKDALEQFVKLGGSSEALGPGLKADNLSAREG